MAAISPRSMLVFCQIRKKLHACTVVVSSFQARHYGKETSQKSPSQSTEQSKPTTKAITISRAMRAYMERAKAHDDLMKAEVADYEIGKRHLANIMGQDPDNFTQEDVDRAIEYLLPSGLFEKKARPMMKNPYEIYPRRRAAQFGMDGRPYHWLYFTTLPNYYNILYDITWKMEGLKEMEDKLHEENKVDDMEGKQINLAGSEWITMLALKDKLMEPVQEKEYNHFILMMERLASHPLSQHEEEFIMQFRNVLQIQAQGLLTPEIKYDDQGRCYAEASGRRKTAEAEVKLYKPGTGKVSINNQDIFFFSNPLHRESLMMPLSLTNLIGEVDIEAQVWYGGPTGQCGAIRLATSKALTAFVDDDAKEQMRLAGLLTQDPRVKERKKPGQERARKKFTWKKR